MLTLVAAIVVGLAHLARPTLASTAHLLASAKFAAQRQQQQPTGDANAATDGHTSNARDVLRAARTGADVDAVRDAVARHAASAHASANQSDAEFELSHHRVAQLGAADWLRIGAVLVALVAFSYATYQTTAAVRRYRGSTGKLSVPIDHKNVKRLWRNAPGATN